MSIEKEYGDYCLICDACDACITEDSFDGAVDAKKREGWLSRKDGDGEWIDVCPDCQERRT